MRLRDFDTRFEETLKANNLTYTVNVREDKEPGLDSSWTWKEFSITPRCPQWDAPLLVNLGKYNQKGKLYRRAKTRCTCFAVKPNPIFAKSSPRTVAGLRLVWIQIKVHCMPL